MGTFLDAQVSQNISFSGGISIPLSSTPALFATLGLNTANAGPNLRIQFTATTAISSLASVAVPITIQIYRGVGPGRVLVYSAIETSPAIGVLGVAARRIITVTGCDYAPPNPGFLVYQAFVSIPGGIVVAPTRTGPESLNAAAYSS
ncbi:hypothetical protein [Peribacillus simplex]|uniref:Exosporium leader peptide n=1 Tax=Peribacillus simplex TaxID=1478 RepID=A0AAW7IBD0_9BACI|nr:hypothetical protein [Peribacillus simplex]MDM5453430.1 hypothetical protein [Peribacillus simplex]